MWTANDFSVARLMEISAQNHGVHVAAEQFQHMKINCCVYVDIGAVTLLRVLPFRRVKRPRKILHEASDVFALWRTLGKANDFLLRLHVNQPAIAVGPDTAPTRT